MMMLSSILLLPLIINGLSYNQIEQSIKSGVELIDSCSREYQSICEEMKIGKDDIQIESIYTNELSYIMKSFNRSDELMESFNGQLTFSNPGASGSFLGFTQDRKFLFKNIASFESEVAYKIIPSLVEHMKRYPFSLLNKILGFFKISWYNSFFIKQTMHVILMENLFPHKSKSMKIYDLKGAPSRFHIPFMPLKSLVEKDFIKNNEIIQLPKKEVLENITLDVLFLKSHNLMDYSLLIGIDQGQVVNFGIIDYFTPFGIIHQLLSYMGCFQFDLQNPSVYSERFLNFMNEIL